MTRPAPPLLVLLACLLPAALQAQGVYRCGNSYSQSPCPGGSAVRVDDHRDPVQKSQADAVTRRDAKAAATLERSRLKEEAARARSTRPRAAYDMAEEAYDDAYPSTEKNPKKPPYFTARAANAPAARQDKRGKEAADPRRTAATRP